MNKIEEIFKAWNISFNPDEKQAELASKRIETCNSCEYKVTNLGVNRCSVCGCALKGKVFSPVKGACPKGKWDEIDGKETKPLFEGVIKEIPNVLNKQECEDLIAMSDGILSPAAVLGQQIDNYRTADNCWINEKNDLIFKIKEIISTETGLPVENQELPHIVKYNVGGEYKTHHDFFHENTDYYEAVTKRGGQRIFSCIFYLNEGFKGGETDFPKLNRNIKPELGKLLVWKNLHDNGEPNRDSLHAGLPVIEGTKWICIIWVREKQFQQI